MADLHIQHLQSRSLLQVGNERRAVLRFDVLYLLVEDDLSRFMLTSVPALEAPCHAYQYDVGDKQQIPCQTVRFETQRVDDRDCDDEEHIVHLADRHGLRAVTNHAEYGEQTEHETRLDIQNLHQPEQQEHAGREEHKLHVVIAPAAVTVINAVNQYPRHQQVEQEHQRHRDEVLAHSQPVGKGMHQVMNTVACAEARCDTRIVLQKLQRRVG